MKTKTINKKTAVKVMQWLDYNTGDYIWDRKNPDYEKNYLIKEIEKFSDIEYSASRIATRIFDMSPNFSYTDYEELKELCSPELFELAIRYYVTSNHDT